MNTKEIRRKQIVRRKRLILFMLTILIILGVGMCFGSMSSKAGADRKVEPVSYKYYTNIEVADGDSLWNIASEYITDDYDSIDQYIKEVKQINSMDSDVVQSGQYITVPYYSENFL